MKHDLQLLRDHVESLCTQNNITLIFGNFRGGRAWKAWKGNSGTIRIPYIRSEVTYAIALHEIGHILGPMQNGRRLEKEAGAWLWAEQNGLIWTRRMKKTRVRLLGTYLSWCQRRKGAWIPPQKHIAWKLAGVKSFNS